MRLWRLTPAQSAGAAFNGEGAFRYGGRWNNPGTRVVYQSSTLALAALETLVHADFENLPAHAALPVDVPDAVLARAESVNAGALPVDWRAETAPAAVRALGDSWVSSARSLLLAVPSVIIPSELNYLLNPSHPDMGRLSLGPAEPFEFDPRLLHRP